jgi:hypothetical protein
MGLNGNSNGMKLISLKAACRKLEKTHMARESSDGIVITGFVSHMQLETADDVYRAISGLRGQELSSAIHGIERQLIGERIKPKSYAAKKLRQELAVDEAIRLIVGTNEKVRIGEVERSSAETSIDVVGGLVDLRRTEAIQLLTRQLQQVEGYEKSVVVDYAENAA